MKSVTTFKWDLDECIAHKIEEIKKSKKIRPLSSFKHKIQKSNRDVINFLRTIRSDVLNDKSIIAEIKTTSPTLKMHGEKLPTFDKIEKAKYYQDVKKASVISILTDEKYFDGNLNDINLIREKVRLPILRKDFIIDEYQIYESRYYGADAILLIAALLKVNELVKFISIARKYNMVCLVEIFDETDLKKIRKVDQKIKINLVGINSRNLRSSKLETNISAAKRLYPKVQEKFKGRFITFESAVNKKNIKTLPASVVLMGHSLLEENPKKHWANT